MQPKPDSNEPRLKDFMHFKESLPTLLMLGLLSLSAVYVFFGVREQRFFGAGLLRFWFFMD